MRRARLRGHAVRRILAVKCQAGLFTFSRDAAKLAEVGSDAHRQVARQAVRESMVLLQNENTALTSKRPG